MIVLYLLGNAGGTADREYFCCAADSALKAAFPDTPSNSGTAVEGLINQALIQSCGDQLLLSSHVSIAVSGSTYINERMPDAGRRKSIAEALTYALCDIIETKPFTERISQLISAMLRFVVNSEDIPAEAVNKAMCTAVVVMRANSFMYNISCNELLVKCCNKAKINSQEVFDKLYYATDIFDQSKLYEFALKLALKLLKMLECEMNGSEPLPFEMSFDDDIHYHSGLIYSLVQSESENISQLKQAYDMHKGVRLLFEEKKDKAVSKATQAIYYSDTGALYLNLGKFFDRYSSILFEDDLVTPYQCFDRAIENQTKAFELRQKAYEDDQNNNTVFDYAKSCETLASTYFYMKNYPKSIEIRRRLFEKVKDFEHDSRLEGKLDNMKDNLVGCYLQIALSRSLTDDEYNECTAILEYLVSKYPKGEVFHERPAIKLEKLKKLHSSQPYEKGTAQ